MKKLNLALGALLALAVPVLAEDMAGEAPAAPAAVAEPAAPTLEILSAQVGTGVEERVIVGESDTFDASGEVFCLTKVKTSNAPTTVHHVWSREGEETADVALPVNGSPWRTWSRKTVWPGAWKVDIKDDAGNVLTSLNLTVTEAAPAPAAEPEPVESDTAQP